ncbi:MAG: radical SAM protein [Deltaproteobacteria bacterium]|nr:radical SAM protein [Deltaproteobacteria bacterium]
MKPDYLNPFHCFKNKSEYYLYVVSCGTTFCIAPHEFKALSLFERRSSFSEIGSANTSISKKLSPKTLGVLKKYRLLTKRKINVQGYRNERSCFQTLELSLSNKCNLRCSYCYERLNKTWNKSGTITKRTAKEAIDWFLNQLLTKKAKNDALIGFQSGEPLTHFNLMRYCVEYAKKRAIKTGVNLRFVVNTNGTLLNKQIIDFLGKNNFTIFLSLDGPRPIHDKYRRYASTGKGTYSDVIKWIPRLLSACPNTFVRGTIVPKGSKSHLYDLLNHANDLGFKRASFEIASLPKGKISSKNYTRSLRHDFDSYFNRYLKKNGNYILYNQLLFLNGQIKRKNKEYYGCGAGRRLLSIDVFGNMWPCADFRNITKYQLGSLKSGVDKESQDRIAKEIHLSNKEECILCWARHLCGGGCAYCSYASTKQLNAPGANCCDLIRHVAEKNIALIHQQNR